MTDIYTTELVALGANLAQMAVKGTATAVSAKIRAIKDEKNAEKIRNTYDEIVNELLSEREEAVRIAQAYEQFMELISVDTLKTMQLIGFNYKTAIGEPLTLMLKNFLLSKVKEPDSVSMFEKVLTPELVEILKDDTAYENFRGILGGESND